MNWEALAIVLLVSIVVERILEAVGEPICATIGNVNPNIKRLAYLIIGSALGWGTGLNAFPVFERWVFTGFLLTAILIGSGSQVVHGLLSALVAAKASLQEILSKLQEVVSLLTAIQRRE